VGALIANPLAMRRLWCAALALMACESGLAREAKVTVPSAIAGGFSASAPGVVVSDLGSDAGFGFTLLCGQAAKDAMVLEQDLGFGCLSEHGGLQGKTETVKVWVQPMPTSAGWDATALCAARTDRSFYDATTFGPPTPDGGMSELLPAPDSSWVQGSGTGTWKRDGSPCGGQLEVDLTLAKP
jgi:hypothetical protein